MKVAKKSPPRRRGSTPARATLTLNMDTYRRIDALRGEQSRAAWLQELVEKEQERRERQEFIDRVNASYTPEVCRRTLELNDEYPIHEG